MQLRCYQSAAVDAVIGRFDAGDQRTLVVLPTGGGKTIVAGHVARRLLAGGGRVMVVAHRDELVRQAADKFAAVTGIMPAIEKADDRSLEEGIHGPPRIVVSSVQTQVSGRAGSERMRRFHPGDFALLWVDEAHHAPAETWRRVIDYYGQNLGCKVLGVTATADRADGEELGQVFQSVAYRYELPDIIEDGYLVPIRQSRVRIDGLDFSRCRTTAGDLNQGDLEAAMLAEKPFHGVAHATIETACGLPRDSMTGIRDDEDRTARLEELIGARGRRRKTLVFTVGIAQAERMAEVFNRWIPQSAASIDGTMTMELRRKTLRWFKDGKIQFLVNCMVCLDDQTEILTDGGWVGIDDMTHQHKVANWKDGRVWFDHPLDVIRRDRRPLERMVTLETPRRSVRVTEDHRMLYRTWPVGLFKTALARDLVGRAAELPVCGEADPLPVSIPYRMDYFDAKEIFGPKYAARRISANAYHIRKRNPALSIEDSKGIAEHEIAKAESRRCKHPPELSLDECRFIGFWVGDGTATKLSRGGVEYTITQSEVYPKIIEWFDGVVSRMGVDVRRRVRFRRTGKKPSGGNTVFWSFCRGTGFGVQRRRGLYEIEPYLEKDGSPLWWGLNAEQFDAFLEGLWMADGFHGDGTEKPAHGYVICAGNRSLLDLVQAIACVRGYRASLRKQTQSSGSGELFHLSYARQDSHRMTKHRLAFEEGWKPERVWCVRVDSGFIVTRRRGSVTVMGNCTEGFDEPGVELVAVARPTKSRALYAQMVGRGTRPAESIAGLLGSLPDAAARRVSIADSGKPCLEVLDFVGNSGRHKLVTTIDLLGCEYDPAALAMAETMAADGMVDVTEALELSQDELERRRREAEAKRRNAEEEAEQRRQEEAAKRAKLVGTGQYHLEQRDPFDQYSASVDRVTFSNPPGVPAHQLNVIRKFKVPEADIAALTPAAAAYLSRELVRHVKAGLCTYKQAKCLKRAGYTRAELHDMTFEAASEAITAVKANGWRRPAEPVGGAT
jgi:superfamily II DNA or RNA helicase